MTEGGRPDRIVVYYCDGRAYMKLNDGWLHLGDEADVEALERNDQAGLLALVRQRVVQPVWHQIPKRLN